jgi:hypothetical protein
LLGSLEAMDCASKRYSAEVGSIVLRT